MGPEAPRFLFDEDADARLARALRERGVDVEMAVEAGLEGLDDTDLLAHATHARRTLVTHNIHHFPGLHRRWLEEGRTHFGIVILVGHSAPAVWLRRTLRLLARYDQAALRDQLLYLGAAFDRG